MLFTTLLFIGGLYFPNDPVMWIASTTTQYESLRGVLIALLLVLLFSHPPRALLFRWFIGALAAGLLLATISSLLSYSMKLLDAVVFVEIAIIFGIEALEEKTVHLPAVTTKAKKKPSFS